MNDEEIPMEREIPTAWIGLDELPVLYVNNLIATSEGDVIHLSIGTTQPPPIMGTPEERIEQVKNISFIPVKPVARTTVTLESLKQFVEILNEAVENSERIQSQKGQR